MVENMVSVAENMERKSTKYEQKIRYLLHKIKLD